MCHEKDSAPAHCRCLTRSTRLQLGWFRPNLVDFGKEWAKARRSDHPWKTVRTVQFHFFKKKFALPSFVSFFFSLSHHHRHPLPPSIRPSVQHCSALFISGSPETGGCALILVYSPRETAGSRKSGRDLSRFVQMNGWKEGRTTSSSHQTIESIHPFLLSLPLLLLSCQG